MARVLVTGGAGFIGSHLVDALVERGDDVVVFDNLATGRRENLAGVMERIRFVEADVRDTAALAAAMQGVEYVSHQGALGSVPRSIEDPLTTHEVNVTGTVNVLVAARDAGVRRVVSASSSSVYGNTVELPKHEGMPMRPRSPYAVSKAAGEQYCQAFGNCYGLETISLRYFNVFGPRQDADHPYAAVIPKFAASMLKGARPRINGSGAKSRDFTYVANVVHANLLCFAAPSSASGHAYNVGTGGQVTLDELVMAMNHALGTSLEPDYGPERAGDVDHSRAAITAAEAAIDYRPVVDFEPGLRRTLDSYRAA